MEGIHDVAHARPARKDRQGRQVPARFDTVLVNEGRGGPTGVEGTSIMQSIPALRKLTVLHLGYRAGRLRLVFALSRRACEQLMPDVIAPGPLAYIEWYTPFKEPDQVHGMYKVSRIRNSRDEIVGDVVEVWNIRRSCHLIPACGSAVPRYRTSSNVLDSCNDYWLNVFSDQHMYMSLF